MHITWKKEGRVFAVTGNSGWMNTHAQIPTVLVLEDRLRVYFATRPRKDLGLTTFVDLDRKDPRRVLHVCERPILEVGRPGTFDNHGIFPVYVGYIDGRVHLYYVGWYRGSSIPYHNAVGLAVSDDDGMTFRKLFDGPVLDRTSKEPYSTGAVYIVEQDGSYHMFYNEVFDWIVVNDRYEPLYHIKHAVSENAIEWTKTDRVCIGSQHAREGVARPSVIRRDGIYHMWFCYRGSDDFRDGRDSYRIGYARSENLLDWNRADGLAGIGVSDTGWDSTMIAYPCVVEVDGEYLMFHNGNGFGTSGFGFARGIWEVDTDEGR